MNAPMRHKRPAAIPAKTTDNLPDNAELCLPAGLLLDVFEGPIRALLADSTVNLKERQHHGHE